MFSRGEHGSPLHFNIHTKTGCTQSVQPVALWLSCAATACSDIILIYLSTLWTLPNIGLIDEPLSFNRNIRSVSLPQSFTKEKCGDVLDYIKYLEFKKSKINE